MEERKKKKDKDKDKDSICEINFINSYKYLRVFSVFFFYIRYVSSIIKEYDL